MGKEWRVTPIRQSKWHSNIYVNVLCNRIDPQLKYEQKRGGV